MMKPSRFGICVAAITLLSFESALVACSSAPVEADSQSAASPIDYAVVGDLLSPFAVPGASCICTGCDDPAADAGDVPDAFTGDPMNADAAAIFSPMPMRSLGKKCLDIGGELGKIGEAAVKLKESLEAAKAFAEKVKTNGGFDVVRNGEKFQIVWKDLTSFERSVQYAKAYGGLVVKIGAMIGAITAAITAAVNGACVRQSDLDKVKAQAQAAKDASDQAINEVQTQHDAEQKGNTEAITELKKQLKELQAQQALAQKALDACAACPAK